MIILHKYIKILLDAVRDKIFKLLNEDGLNSGETLFYFKSNKDIYSLINYVDNNFNNFRDYLKIKFKNIIMQAS